MHRFRDSQWFADRPPTILRPISIRQFLFWSKRYRQLVCGRDKGSVERYGAFPQSVAPNLYENRNPESQVQNPSQIAPGIPRTSQQASRLYRQYHRPHIELRCSFRADGSSYANFLVSFRPFATLIGYSHHGWFSCAATAINRAKTTCSAFPSISIVSEFAVGHRFLRLVCMKNRDSRKETNPL